MVGERIVKVERETDLLSKRRIPYWQAHQPSKSIKEGLCICRHINRARV